MEFIESRKMYVVTDKGCISKGERKKSRTGTWIRRKVDWAA